MDIIFECDEHADKATFGFKLDSKVARTYFKVASTPEGRAVIAGFLAGMDSIKPKRPGIALSRPMDDLAAVAD